MVAKKGTMKDLKSIKDRVEKKRRLRKGESEARITVHLGTCGLASGAQTVMDRVLSERSKRDRPNIAVCSTGCIGLCSREPLITVERIGEEPVIYQRVDDRKMEQIFKRHMLEGKVQVDFALARGTALNEAPEPMHSDLEGILPHVSRLKFFSLQKPRVLRNKGLIDPEKMEDYIWRDGYRAVAKALLEMTPAKIISEVKGSGLRNRDARGFPTGIEWEFCAHSKEEIRYVVCTADEGDPGASIGCRVLEADPHTVLEGMIIAARAVGAHQGYLFCRPEFSLAVKRLNQAVEQARTFGLLGKDILGSGFDFDIEVVLGGGPFLCSEETALFEAIEGRPGIPRPHPTLPAVSGLREKPTLLNNVETYINIPRIMLMGGEGYGDVGTESSKGTKLFYLAGKVNNTGLIEVPMGTTVGEIIFDMGEGIPGGKKFKAVQLGGLSGGFIPPQHLNTPIDYDALSKLGARLGSGSMIVTDDETCMVEMACYFIDFCLGQVCGKCANCRVQPERMQEILRRIRQGQGRDGDIELLEGLGQEMKKTALCALGQAAPDPVLSTLRYFRQEYEAHIRDKRCPAAVCSALFKSPCQHTCPVGMDVPAYIALIRAGRIDDAYKILKRTNPFPSVCGRVCSHPCESKCRRGQLDEPVAIMHLKRFIADHAKRSEVQPLKIVQKEKVAIVGAGPSGLSVALELKRRGYGVTVFEELPEAGGMLRWCIPAYRLPREELRREIDEILRTGVELRVNTRVGRDIMFEDLDRMFDIIYLSVGAQKRSSLNIPGEEAEGVFDSVDFLRAYNLGKEIKVGKHVAVIGHGITSVDAARTATRLGAKKVTLYFRHDRKDIPAQEWELEAASEEGVQMQYLVAPVRVITQYGKVRGLELTHMRPNKFDSIGRRHPIPILGSEFIEKAETVLSTVTTNADLGFLPEGSGIEINEGTVRVDKNLRTTNAKVWAGGDMVTGPAAVIDAIRAGRTAARAIDAAIRATHGQEPWTAPAEEMLEIPLTKDEEQGRQLRRPMPKVPPKIRRSDFREVELGYPPEMALAEVCRCLRCDVRPQDDE
ncbi:MAG TPA: NADH-ubiquinone oxidoreductase-F iron-sulfur binding region domain-containing protein [Thermodesulfobacteriota bacterium]|nr:NADH-ubiquinone oxidoreductase-F iron-sulfur binding region domain-containing protein [Thermodesulfobacteriota bacterium]